MNELYCRYYNVFNQINNILTTLIQNNINCSTNTLYENKLKILLLLYRHYNIDTFYTTLNNKYI